MLSHVVRATCGVARVVAETNGMTATGATMNNNRTSDLDIIVLPRLAGATRCIHPNKDHHSLPLQCTVCHRPNTSLGTHSQAPAGEPSRPPFPSPYRTHAASHRARVPAGP